MPRQNMRGVLKNETVQGEKAEICTFPIQRVKTQGKNT